MRLPKVYPILDSEAMAARGIALETAAAAFLEGGAEILQLRHKGQWSRAVFESARKVVVLCREAGAQFGVSPNELIQMPFETGFHATYAQA